MMATIQTSLKVTDPVCGMELDPAEAPQTREVMGQTFYFCSNYCADIFNPDMTAADQAALRAVLWGRRFPIRLPLALGAKGITRGTINKLISFFGGE